jgi:HEAT repeat protein
MLDATGKKLLRLLQRDQPLELRCAAARVLSEVGSRDAELTTALSEALGDPEPTLRQQVLATIGQLRIEQALPQLLQRVSEGGTEAELAAQAAARLGAKGTRALQDLMSHVAPGLRRRIASALGTGGTPSAGSAAIEMLLDTDPGVVDAAVRSLTSEIPSLTQAQRRGLTEHVLELVKPRKGSSLSIPSEAACIRLLAALDDPCGEPAFWARAAPGHAPELRAAALQALGTLPPPENKDRIKLLLCCAAAPDFRVAAPALMILKAVPVTERTTPNWLPLLDAPDAAVRRFAIDKLSGRDTPEIAGALLWQIHHPDRELRDAALARLTQMEHGRAALTRALLEASSPEEAWSLTRAQAHLAQNYAPALRKKLFTQACHFLEEEDRRADPLLFLLREVDARGLRDQLEERALSLRKKKAYDKALIYLRLLARDPACAESIRFELAGCGIKLSDHDLTVEMRQADPSLQQLGRLIHSHDIDPAERLRQAKWLDADDLFFIGFHFAEGSKPERDFGAEALRQVIKRSPRSKLAKDARSKLRSAGFTS